MLAISLYNFNEIMSIVTKNIAGTIDLKWSSFKKYLNMFYSNKYSCVKSNVLTRELTFEN
jgi:hypothetical protein